MKLNNIKSIYLVRHGEVYNPHNIIYGNLPGYSLSENGILQIQNVADQLFDKTNNPIIFSSPLERAIESAEIISSKFKTNFIVDNHLKETNIGVYEGKKFNELPVNYINENGIYPEIESAKSIRKRMLKWIDQIKNYKANKYVIAISHKDPIIILLLHFMKKKIDDTPKIKLDPGRVFKIQYDDEIIIQSVI